MEKDAEKGVEHLNWHSMKIQDVLNALQTKETGLTQEEAQIRFRRYGENILRGKKPKTLLQRFLSQFADFMILILLGAAAVSFVTARMNGEDGFTDSAVILGIVVLNAIIGTVQEVLFEQTEGDFFTGHAKNFVKVYARGENLHNELCPVRITALREDGVEGELCR